MDANSLKQDRWQLTEQRIAAAVGIKLTTLRFMSTEKYKRTRGYETRRIRKRYDGVREIDAPNIPLKKVQRWILRNILNSIEIHNAAHGFLPNRSIMTNAAAHVRQNVVIRLDLTDFFGSVRYPRVLGMFLALGYTKSVARLLTGLTTYNGHLPQGAPTSPAITNILCRRLDARLAGLATSLDYTYTRYADDLTFSGTTIQASPDRLIQIVSNIVHEEGFELNPRKTSIMRKGSQQKVTGLIVNEKINVPRVYRRTVRAEIYNARRDGLAKKEGPVAHVRRANVTWLQKVEGKVSYIYRFNVQLGSKLRHEIDQLLHSNAVYVYYAGRRKPKGPFPNADHLHDYIDAAYADAADTSECEDLWDHSESDATDTNRSFKDDNTDGRDFDMDGLYDVEELFEDIEDYNPPDYASDDYWDDLF